MCSWREFCFIFCCEIKWEREERGRENLWIWIDTTHKAQKNRRITRESRQKTRKVRKKKIRADEIMKVWPRIKVENARAWLNQREWMGKWDKFIADIYITWRQQRTEYQLTHTHTHTNTRQNVHRVRFGKARESKKTRNYRANDHKCKFASSHAFIARVLIIKSIVYTFSAL